VAVVLECACGPVAVKRVASAGVRGIGETLDTGYRTQERLRLIVANVKAALES